MCAGPGRDPGSGKDWSVGGRLFHIHQLSQQTQLLCWRRDCHYCSPGQVQSNFPVSEKLKKYLGGVGLLLVRGITLLSFKNYIFFILCF